MLDKSANAGSHTHAERAQDFYETPEVAVTALLGAENLPRVIWEPACGRGAIALPLMRAGHRVYASDLHDYGFGYPGLNFLMARRAPLGVEGVEAIVTNPPFMHAQAFVEKALELAPRVVMLMRLAFLESERRGSILDDGRLARVFVFRNRLPMMHRDGWTGPKSASATAFAWFVWERDRRPAPAELIRISWKPK